MPARHTGHRTAARHQSSRRMRQRGAAIVEAALVTPLLVFLLLGTIEAGTLVNAGLSVEEMVGHAVRTASIAGRSPDADVRILDRIEHETRSASTSRIQRVVVYEAAGRGSGPTDACKAGTAGPACNVYGPTDLRRPAAALSCTWCPSAREPGDLIGVWISYRQPSATGLLSDHTLTSHGVSPIEAAT